MTIPTKTLERIRNLLAKAERTDNEHERDTFTSAAAALIAKYGIDQAMLGAETKQDKPTMRRIEMHGGQHAARRMELFSWLADAMRCKVMFTTSGRHYRIAHIYGFESDIDRVELLYTSLLLQVTSALNRLKTPYGENSRAYRNSWIKGFIWKAVQMVMAREAQAVNEAEDSEVGTSKALVLASREQRVEAFFKEANPGLKRRKTAPSSSAAGWQDGEAAGSRANLGGTGLENRQRALPR